MTQAGVRRRGERRYEYVTTTGKVELMEAPPLSPLQLCQDDCAYDCEDECGYYDADGRFIERRPGCYERCYERCTQVPLLPLS